MTLDEASQQLLATLAAGGAPPLYEQTPAMVRMTGPVFAGMSGPGPEVGRVRNLEIYGDDGQFRLRVLQPRGTPKAIVVYYHGGGWVIGDIDLQYDCVARQLIERTDCTFVMVGYRKAPEHPFPTPLEDCWHALQWVDAHRTDLAPEGVPLIVAGDSAGGNLSAVITHRARDRGGPKIDYQVLVYPVTDCDMERPSYNAPENQLIVGRDLMEWFFGYYEPDGEKRKNPEISPIRHENLSDLPPALVYIAEHDPLHDEGKEYAERLRAAGNEVELETAEGQMHGYFQMANLLPGYETGLRLVAAKINDFVSTGDRT